MASMSSSDRAGPTSTDRPDGGETDVGPRHASDERLLDVLLDAWDRHNTILVNLARALPQGGLEARAIDGSPSVSEMLTHMHHERMVSVFEEAPEFAGRVPEQEWVAERDVERIASLLNESARIVRDAVRKRVETGRPLALHFDHPILLLQFLIFHESYHHGQIKLALKRIGRPLPDDVAGPLTWGVWRRRRDAAEAGGRA